MTSNPSRAALFAAIGTALVTLFYTVNNVWPVLLNLGSMDPLEVIRVLFATTIPMALWTWLFLGVDRASRGIASRPTITTLAGTVALYGVAPQMLAEWVRQYPSLSLLSLDTWMFVFPQVLLPLLWLAILTLLWRGAGAGRIARWAGLVFLVTGISALSPVISAILGLWDTLTGTLAAFWSTDPVGITWRLLLTPVIVIFYWITQLGVLRALRKQRLAVSPAIPSLAPEP